MRKNKEIDTYYFDRKVKENYFVGDLIRFQAPFFTEMSRIGIIIRVIKDDKEIFRNIILEVYNLDGTYDHTLMPFFDDIEILSRNKRRK